MTANFPMPADAVTVTFLVKGEDDGISTLFDFDASQSLVGMLDEFAVFDRVLPAQEISDQHAAGFSPPISILSAGVLS